MRRCVQALRDAKKAPRSDVTELIGRIGCTSGCLAVSLHVADRVRFDHARLPHGYGSHRGVLRRRTDLGCRSRRRRPVIVRQTVEDALAAGCSVVGG